MISNAKLKRFSYASEAIAASAPITELRQAASNMCLCFIFTYCYNIVVHIIALIPQHPTPPEASCLSVVILCMGLQDIYKDYGKPMWYKNTTSVGIKRKFGDKKQIIYFGGRKCTLSKEALLKLGDDCVKKLNGGMTEADVKAWVVEQAK